MITLSKTSLVAAVAAVGQVKAGGAIIVIARYQWPQNRRAYLTIEIDA